MIPIISVMVNFYILKIGYLRILTMTHLLKPEDRRDYGMNGDKPGCTAFLVAIGAMVTIGLCGAGFLAVIFWLSRIVGLKGW